jgi:hypothetical protein
VWCLVYTWFPLICLWKARFTDPGRLPVPEQESESIKKLASIKPFQTCVKCEAKKFERAHHC